MIEQTGMESIFMFNQEHDNPELGVGVDRVTPFNIIATDIMTKRRGLLFTVNAVSLEDAKAIAGDLVYDGFLNPKVVPVHMGAI